MRTALPLVLLSLLLALPGSAMAQADGPVKLSDVSDMVRDGKDAEAILVAMSERGIDFRLKGSTEKRLRDWGFTDEQLKQVIRIADGMALQPPDERGDKPNNPPPAAGAGGEFPVGHGIADEREAAMAEKRLAHVVQGAGLDGYQLYPLERFTLYCSPKTADKLLPALRQMDKQIVAGFPKAIANATSPKTALLAVSDNKAEGLTIEETYKASYKVDYPSADLGKPGFFGYRMYQDISIVSLANYEQDKVERLLAFGWGYMTARQLSRGYAPPALTAGLGDVFETMAFGSPSILFGEDSTDNKDSIDDWADYVKQTAEKGRLPTARAVLGYTYDQMRDEHYAAAWSLTRYLGTEPMQFYAVLKGLGDTDKNALELIYKEYKVNDRDLQKAWITSVLNKTKE